MKTSLIALLIFIVSCNNGNPIVAKTVSIAVKNDTVKTQKDKMAAKTDTVTDNQNNDSTIYVRFQRDSIATTVEGEMKGFGHPVTVYIPIKQGRHFAALVTSDDSTANVRINQIITPDGKADGPFGREWKFAIRQRGMYKLLIAENLMQGDEWKGKFKLRITVK